jgi:hypothetical protein
MIFSRQFVPAEAMAKVCAAAGLAIVIAAASFASASFFWRTQPLAVVFNSDILVLVDFFHDLTNFPAVADQFQFPRVPSFAPDLVTLVAVSTTFPDFHLAMFAYAVVQCAAILAVATWLVSLCTGKSALRCGIVVAMLTCLTIVLNATFLPLFTLAYVGLFTPVMHFGSLLLSLAAACIFLLFLEKPDAIRSGLLALISIAAFASDKLYILTFAAPAVLAAVVLWRHGKVSSAVPWRVGALLVLSFVAGLLLLQLVPTQRAPPVAKVLVHIAKFVKAMATEIAGAPVAYLCLLIGPLVLVAVAPRLARFPPRLKLAWLMGSTAMVLTLGFGAAFFEDFNSLRYWPALIAWPIILTGAVLVLSFSGRLFRFAAPTAAAAVLVFGASELRSTTLAGLQSWRDPLADCLLLEHQQFGLKDGLADFWLARPAVISSGWRLQIEQIGGGRYGKWGNNPYWATHSRVNPGQPPVFNYVVPGRINSDDDIKEHFGSPSRIEQCAGHPIWIYDRPLDPLKDAWG